MPARGTLDAFHICLAPPFGVLLGVLHYNSRFFQPFVAHWEDMLLRFLLKSF